MTPFDSHFPILYIYYIFFYYRKVIYMTIIGCHNVDIIGFSWFI
nr:MAG TPA: hypothetical protein [Caudoviricetes sp.]